MPHKAKPKRAARQDTTKKKAAAKSKPKAKPVTRKKSDEEKETNVASGRSFPQRKKPSRARKKV